MDLALIAAHLSNSSLDEVAGWSLRQCVAVTRRYRSVLPFLGLGADSKAEPVRDPQAVKSIAHAFGLVRPS